MPACSIEELKYRIMMKKYKNLDKLFISKSMCEMFSQKHGCELIFTSVENPYYWNSQFYVQCINY